MSQKAKFVKTIKVIDPDSKLEVEIEVYKHENGGMFAIDASFIEQVLGDLGEAESAIIMDPFEPTVPTQLYLED
jgi:hypothetical protein